jgi:uncharacterized membrane protein YeaQ/YmgE (transglycosylase-associated protein family)
VPVVAGVSPRDKAGKKVHANTFVAIFGAATGWVTRNFILSEGRDRVMDPVMGVAGGVGGGFVLEGTTFHAGGRMIYTSLAAVLGAVIFTMVARYVVGRQEFGSMR